jgi:diguanylate cyclase (GGDEF)-like protein
LVIAVENARLLEATQRNAEEQRLLFNAARDFSAGLSEEAVLQAIVRHMVSVLNVAGCAVSLWEPANDRVVTLFDYDTSDETMLDQPGVAYALADYPVTRRVLESQHPLVVRTDDPEADPAECALLKQLGYETLLMLPLAAGEHVFGLVELTRRAGAPRFSEADLRLGRSLAVEAGVALENARLHTTVRERVRELDALLTANTAMLSTLDLDPLLNNILQAAIAAIPAAEKGTILFTDAAEAHDADAGQLPRLQIRAIAGYTDPRIQTFTFAGSEGYSAKAAREKCPLLVPDARADPEIRYAGDIPEVREILSAIVAPLMHHDHPLGVISLDATRRAAFAEADLRLLVAFANAAAVAIDNARLHAEVRALAVTDGLTGLANHRAFNQALEAEVPRAGRYGYPVSLVFLDIDSFKLYNDTYGHPAGNERLKAFAALLRERVRDPDLAARYGGEEFALVLPHTPKDGAFHLAERIRAAAEAAVPDGCLPGAPVSGYTLSLGVAAFPDDARTPEDLLLAADNAALAAKRAGKNRVVAAPPLNRVNG